MKMLTFNEAKQIPIVEYLNKLGITPAKIRATTIGTIHPSATSEVHRLKSMRD